jgi:plastocyanin
MGIARRLGWLVLVGLGAACGGSDDGNNPDLSLSKAATGSGDNQTGATESLLPDSIRVLVLEDGLPREGVTVTWSAQGTTADVTPNTSVTDAEGLAASTWLLGLEGSQTARARVSGAGGSPVTFNAIGTGANGATFGNDFFRSNKNGSRDPAVDTVTVDSDFVWTGIAGTHTVRSFDTPSFLDSGDLSGAGSTYTVTFDTPGTYRYDCEIHGSDMTGRIVVVP